MRLKWSRSAIGDLARLHAFLAPVNPTAATRLMGRLKQAPKMLQVEPRLGASLLEFAPREVRRMLVDDYELRYEVADDLVIVLRLWHTREDR
ncbi:MAG: type II toxin-antitoxin system RelE/ParE family toxin [Proteobacteria bacterium]|nr:type II toxin-antitoxin system RelE/ParE family toxin [Burkholderiales bacterium]